MASVKALALLWWLLLPLGCSADRFTFVVAGDGRADSSKSRPEDRDGINLAITGEIAAEVLRENAKMLLWTGDLVVGSKDAGTFERQLLRWRDVMEPLYRAKVAVLPVRGNHDAFSADSVSVWNRVFSGPYALPRNGPAGEENLTFYFGKGSVLVIGLDQYATPGHRVNQAWLDAVLRERAKPFVFAFAHEPAFMAGKHKDTMEADLPARDAFVKSLLAAGSRVFFAGHDHFYDHMLITPDFHQLVAGTAGAPFYGDAGYQQSGAGWTTRRIAHVDNTYGYLLVQVDGNRATITFKGKDATGRYVPMDSFSVVATPGSPRLSRPGPAVRPSRRGSHRSEAQPSPRPR